MTRDLKEKMLSESNESIVRGNKSFMYKYNAINEIGNDNAMHDIETVRQRMDRSSTG